MIGLILVGILLLIFLIVIRRRIMRLLMFWKKDVDAEERVPVVNFSKTPATSNGAVDVTVPAEATKPTPAAAAAPGESYQNPTDPTGRASSHVTITLPPENAPKNGKFPQPSFQSSVDLVKAYIRSFTD